ncbi:MAG: hypothetical protein Q8Q13_03080, partial [bacterium]|nr:hypothetical protein [bacterium]
MSEKAPKQNQKEAQVGGRLSPEDVRRLLDKYGEKGLKQSDHVEFFQINDTRIQKLKTVGMLEGKPKSIERRIREL